MCLGLGALQAQHVGTVHVQLHAIVTYRRKDIQSCNINHRPDRSMVRYATV